jgi:hypothetical protein
MTGHNPSRGVGGLRQDLVMTGADEWTADGRFYAVTVFSDVTSRDGLGWELSDVAPVGRGDVLEIFRSDSGAVPTLTSTWFRSVPEELVLRFAKAAVVDLLGESLNMAHGRFPSGPMERRCSPPKRTAPTSGIDSMNLS